MREVQKGDGKEENGRDSCVKYSAAGDVSEREGGMVDNKWRFGREQKVHKGGTAFYAKVCEQLKTRTVRRVVRLCNGITAPECEAVRRPVLSSPPTPGVPP